MLAMTFLYFLIELVFGYISHSMALIADSFHMMSDVMALSIAYGCLKVFFVKKISKQFFPIIYRLLNEAEVLGTHLAG